MYAGGDLVAAFRVGKPSASYTETYVRREGSNDVYLADGMFSYTFVQQPKDWRDKSIYRNEPDLVKSVTYRYGDTTFTLAMNDSLWRLNGDSVSQTTVRSVLGSLANLQADGFWTQRSLRRPRRLPSLMSMEHRSGSVRTKEPALSGPDVPVAAMVRGTGSGERVRC